MRSCALITVVSLGLAAPATAEEPVPAEYQGVWAAARDCKSDLQNILPAVVDRASARCAVVRVERSAGPETRTSAVDLACGRARIREIWRDETVGDTDYLVVARLGPDAANTGPSLDLYARCPGIPLAALPFSAIAGDPAPEAVAEDKPASAPAVVHNVSKRPVHHAPAGRARKHVHKNGHV